MAAPNPDDSPPDAKWIRETLSFSASTSAIVASELVNGGVETVGMLRRLTRWIKIVDGDVTAAPQPLKKIAPAQLLLIYNWAHPPVQQDVSDTNIMQALDKLEEKLVGGQKKLEEKFEEKFKDMEVKMENIGDAISDDVRDKVLPLIVGLIDESRQSRCVGVGSFVGTRLILTACHNLPIDGEFQPMYRFRTSGPVDHCITYTCKLLRYDKEEDWALLSSDIEAPGCLKLSDKTLRGGEKVVMLGFGIGLANKDAFVDADSYAIEALYPYSVDIKASHISTIQENHLFLDSLSGFPGDSGSALILAKNGDIVGMHVMHHNNAEPLPPSHPDEKTGEHGKGKKRPSTSASSPPLKRRKQETKQERKQERKQGRQDAFNEHVKRSIRSLTASTSYVAMALIVSNLKSLIDEWNKKLRVSSSSSSAAAASPPVTTSRTRGKVKKNELQ